MLRVCLDIDNCITASPKFFSLLSHAIKNSGGQVYVITSRTRSPETMDATRKELNEMGIAYNHLFILHDQEEADKICPFNDLDWYQKLIFQKTVYCRANGVTHYFDDETKVIELFRRFLPEVQAFQVHRKGSVWKRFFSR